MATEYTTNYHLIKPDYADDADVADLNDNFDTLDTTIKNIADGRKTTQTAVSDPSADGTSLTFIATLSQNTNGVITPTKKTVKDMVGAGSSNGAHGLVPQPLAADKDKYLKGDGTWASPANTDTKNTAGSTDTSSKIYLIGATSQAANPQTYSHDTAYVGTDGCLYSGGTKVLTAHQSISGKKNTQSAVSDPTASGTSLTFIATISQNDQGVITPTKKTVKTMVGATSNTAGAIGLVPQPGAGKNTSFLRGDGTWVVPTNTTYSDMTGATSGAAGTHGLVPAPGSGKNLSFLRGDGTWVVPTDTDTKNTAGTTNSTSKLYICGATSQGANPQTYSNSAVYEQNGSLYASKVYNAVWNDYAECRESNISEPGRVVRESVMGVMVITDRRMMRGCKIISDTYGACMGETEKAKTPIGVAGRVLAYPYRDRNKYYLGAPVCSGPNGTVDVMNRLEAILHPECIIGTVSEIPRYEKWVAGTKDDPKEIEVKGRIWIYVR